MNSTLSSIEVQARTVENSINAKKSQDAALEATIRSVELYMQALRFADNPSDRKRLDKKCKDLLNRAEQLKSQNDFSPKHLSVHSNPPLAPISTRTLTKREQIILLEGGLLNGFKFRPWDQAPFPNEFELRDGGEPFTDSPELSLSSTQIESFAGWKRPIEALAMLPGSGNASHEPFMDRRGKVDLVQDLTSDCSVVASLCAASARADQGHTKIGGSLVFPYDQEKQAISLSPNGKYIFKLYFNGCWRRVEIDDRLPTSKTHRVLYVIDRVRPGLLWPALAEKAYLKVRGGYDFPGSNSGTDLAVLTGWIPQQVFLHGDEVDPEQLWHDIYDGFNHGNILMTIGTGKLSRREQKHLGLGAEHDYAVLDMQQNGHAREMLIKNPWVDGDVWRGATRRKPNPSHDTPDEMESGKESEEMLPGTFWMDFNNVFHYFENMYINWNPALFPYRQDLHFSWQISSEQSTNLFVDNPQFAVQSSKGGEIWLLLNRHFKTGHYTQANNGKNGYISLYLYSRDGKRVLTNENVKVRGPFIDSPNTLLRFDMPSNAKYTALVASQDLPLAKHNFTLSVFSSNPCTLAEATLQYPQKMTISAAWTRSTAGGNSDSPNYVTNPQFNVNIQKQQRVAFVACLADGDDSPNKKEVHIKIDVVFSNGVRITKLRSRDIMAQSGDYRRGCAVVETSLDKGSYTIICSTFGENQYAKFNLDLYSSVSASTSMTLLPSERSGRLSITSNIATFPDGIHRVLAPLTVNRITKAIFIAHSKSPSSSSSLFKLTLEQGQGPYKQTVASSEMNQEEYQSIAGGLRIQDLVLSPSANDPSSGGLWIVLERLARTSGPAKEVESLQLEILVEERIEIGDWGRGDG